MNHFCTLDIRKYADKKANYHTHTTRCQHAHGDDREYIEKAIEAGYEILGFSDHAPHVFENGYVSPVRMKMSELDEYVSTLERLRKEYEKDIQIFIGLETEYWPKVFEASLKHYQEYPVDYMILGQHHINDEASEQKVENASKSEVELQSYVNRVIEAINTGYFMYVAHPDIFNFDGDEKVYDKYMNQLIAELKKRKLPIEINCLGYRARNRKIRPKPYPRLHFVELAAKQGCDFIVGMDAHKPEQLADYENVDGCVKMAQQFGGKVISYCGSSNKHIKDN